MPLMQRGLFGVDYKVSPTCDGCGRCITSNVFDAPDDKKFCADCMDVHGLVGCENCRNAVSDCVITPDGDDWCEPCYDEVYTACEKCDDPVDRDDCVEVHTSHGYRSPTETWCDSCASREATKCDECGELGTNEHSHRAVSGCDICDSCYEDNYFTCDGCGEIYHNDDHHSGDYGAYCADCRPGGGDFDPAGFSNHSGSLTKIGSARCYGIELETDDCDDYHDLEGHAAWGAKDDPTVNGKEFFSDVLSGDDGLQAIRDWSNLADCHGWRAGRNAGYHLHLDLTHDSDDSRFAIAYAYRASQEVWLSFVESRRRDGGYCGRPRYCCADIELAAAGRTYYDWAYRTPRYVWANASAYSPHKTIEIRLHQGTCNGLEVCNWVKAHTRFADWAATKGLAGIKEALEGLSCDDMFDLIAREAWQDGELRTYYANKTTQYS